MSDYAAGAEELFRAFAQRHALSIDRKDNPQVDIEMLVPAQNGLNFDICLCLQNGDELNLGVGRFWSYFYPFPDAREKFASLLDDVVSGDCRVAEYERFGRLAKCTLERLVGGEWQTIYVAYNGLPIPFVKPRVANYIRNNPAG